MKTNSIVFFTPIVPLPPTGGGTRTFHLLKAMGELAPVDLFVFTSLQDGEKEQLKQICRSVHSPSDAQMGQRKKIFFWKLIQFCLPFFASSSQLSGKLNIIQQQAAKKKSAALNFLFNWLMFWFKRRAAFPSETYRAMNNMLALKEQADHLLKQKNVSIFVDFSFFIPAIKKIYAVNDHQIFGNAHNVESELSKQAWRKAAKKTLSASWLRQQYKLMQHAEKEALQFTEITLCCSVADKLRFEQECPLAKTVVVPNGVDTNYFVRSRPKIHNKNILFTGTMNYDPNAEAVYWFVQDIWPHILHQHPEATLIVAGRDAGQLLLKKNDRIQIISSPADIRPAFEKSAIYVVPLKHGSGTRLKILEAAAMKCAVVSTSLGAEGIEGLTGENIILANDPVDFANAVNGLIENTVHANEIARRLHDLITEQYSWDKITTDVKFILQ